MTQNQTLQILKEQGYTEIGKNDLNEILFNNFMSISIIAKDDKLIYS
jgi:hypothetical protein